MVGRRSSGLPVQRRASLIALVAFAVAACGESRPAASAAGSGASGASCVACHGDASRLPASIAPAPPIDTRGKTATSAPGVGAHQRHLRGGSIRNAIDCTECHVVPTTVAHATQPLVLTWGSLASARGASPSFDGTKLTCANYCHGSTMAGGAITAPAWNLVDGTQAACGTCHGLPPASPHPLVSGGVTSCARCHSGTVNPDGTIDLVGGLHVNGVVDVSGGGSCTGCHGDAARLPSSIAAAPPADTAGNTSTSAPSVGAHQIHLVGGKVRGPLACTSCHTVPTDMAHVSQPLDLTWGSLARADGATPTFDATKLTCANYCHGSTLTAGLITAPVWNKVDGTQAACGTCHGLPPSSPHPPVGSITACANCHPGTVNPDGSIKLAGGLHVNGIVDVSSVGCTACHGDTANGAGPQAFAPPRGTRGETQTSQAAVGAHQRHLVGGKIRGPIACNDCHVFPTNSLHASQPLDLTWGELSRTNGAVPTFDGTKLTCANYCHGATLTAGLITAPVWNKVDGSQAACGTCHGLPPSAPHPMVGTVTACVNCHAGTVNPDGTINVAGGLHIDGVVQISGGSGSCSACHGDPNRQPAAIAAAPPVDTSGSTANSSPGVGAHQSHLAGGSIRGPVECTECHVVPTDLRHASQPLQLTWGPLARAGGSVPTWNGTSLTCANYCHGATLPGGLLTAPVWNKVDGTQAACGTCHGLPPAAPHPAVSSVTGCVNCHAGTVNPDGTINVAGALHIDGVVQLSGGSGSCTGCHGDATRLPFEIAAAPPVDTSGNTAATSPGVGAHQRHLAGGSVRGPLPCSSCHKVPSDLAHASQPLDLSWGPLARIGGTVPTWNGTSFTCANYCHGSTMAGGALTAPVWNKVDGTQAACGTCHGLPPAAPHPPVNSITACAGCHPGTVNPNGTILVSGGLHVDGIVQVASGSATCTACHGDATRQPASIAAAPPVGTRGETLTTQPAVGAHQRHLVGGTLRGPLACGDCHTVPTDFAHASQPLDLTWGPLARTGGAVPTWNGTSFTCANYCHGSTMAGGALTAPVWNKVDGTQAACGACHGLPPPAPHPSVGSMSACVNCHAGSIRADGSIDLAGALHLNGVVDVSGSNSCTACHGDATRLPSSIAAAPPVGTRGETLTSQPAVGAHQRHLVGGSVRGPLACAECHVVPTDFAHANQPLDLTWGSLARTGGTVPSWNAVNVTCTNYCHGASITGGSLAAPVWTKVDSTQAACGTCHGLPPAAPHPIVTGALTACAGCHAGTVNADGTIKLAGGLHIDGFVQLAGGSGSCTGCHGDATRTPASIAAAPPKDTSGNTATTSPGVGAHQTHLVGGSIRSALLCTDCHVVPADLAHASQPLDLTWGTLARTGGTTPAWNATLLTCANYCHGATLAGGSLTAPVWNTVNGTQAACGTCHGLPPASPHPSVSGGVTACSGCHAGTVNPDGTIKLTGGLHINGVVEVAGTGGCTGCHGDSARTPTAIAPAPPLDTHGNITTTAGGVGAHQRHLTGGLVRGPIACTECHTVPGDLVHASQPLVLTWGPLATALGASASFNPTSLTCANYCHGATMRGGSITAPLWNKVDNTQAACGTCHGLPPSSPHPTVSGGLTACAGCHPGTINPDGSINVAGGLHIDGAIQATGGHADFTSPAVHGPQFFDFMGSVPGALSCNGCHGANYGGGSGPSCNACHATAGWIGWQTNCSFCHGTKNATTQAGYTVADHPTWSAPPDALSQRLSGTPAPNRTGAHQVHLTGVASNGQSYAPPFACGTCHVVPTGLAAPHIDGAAARATVVLPQGSYDPATGTCATQCHGSTMAGTAGNSVAQPFWNSPGFWTVGNGAISCEKCHGVPPGTGLHGVHYGQQGIACGHCHFTTAAVSPYFPPALVADRSAHVNGTVDVQYGPASNGYFGDWNAAGRDCAVSCHGYEIRQWQ